MRPEGTGAVAEWDSPKHAPATGGIAGAIMRALHISYNNKHGYWTVTQFIGWGRSSRSYYYNVRNVLYRIEHWSGPIRIRVAKVRR